MTEAERLWRDIDAAALREILGAAYRGRKPRNGMYVYPGPWEHTIAALARAVRVKEQEK